MTQQEAEKMFREELVAFQMNNTFEIPDDIILTPKFWHENYLDALKYLTPVTLNISLDEFIESQEFAESPTLKQMGLLIHVLEKTSAHQLNTDLRLWNDLAHDMALCSAQYRTQIEPETVRLNRKIQALQRIQTGAKSIPIRKVEA